MSDTNPKRQQALDFFMSIRDGAFLDEIYEAVVSATDGVQQFGKSATVNAQLVIEAVNDELMISGAVGTKLPARKPRAQFFFFRKDGLPSRRDERQADMFDTRPQLVTEPETGKAVNQ